jgi:hypothetical protein
MAANPVADKPSVETSTPSAGDGARSGAASGAASGAVLRIHASGSQPASRRCSARSNGPSAGVVIDAEAEVALAASGAGAASAVGTRPNARAWSGERGAGLLIDTSKVGAWGRARAD